MSAGTVVAVAHDTSENIVYTWTRFPLEEEDQTIFNASNWERFLEKLPLSTEEKDDFGGRSWWGEGHDLCTDCDRHRPVFLGQHPDTDRRLILCLPCMLERSRGFKLVMTRKQNNDFIAIHNGIRLEIVDGRIKEIKEFGRVKP